MSVPYHSFDAYGLRQILQACDSDTLESGAVKWLADNWGSVASVLGLILSAWAAVASTRAKRAADAARTAVELRSLASALKNCGDDVASLALHFDSENWRLAERVVSRTLRDIAYISSRWDGHLDDVSTRNLSLVSGQLSTMLNALTKLRSVAPRDSELRGLHKSVTRLDSLLAMEIGKSESRVEVVAAVGKRSQ